MRAEIRVVYNGEHYEIEYFLMGAMVHYEASTVPDWESLRTFLLTGVLPG